MALIDKVKGAPVDRVAALVMSRSRYGYDDKAHIDPRRIHSEAPPVMRRLPRGMPADRDLTGHRHGWLTVRGMLDHDKAGRNSKTRKKRGALWVVRCVCGRYEVRARRSLVNENNREDRCDACWKLANMKRHRDYLDGKPQRDAWEY